MDWNILGVTLQALTLLGVVWKGSDIVTSARKDTANNEKRWEEQVRENRINQEARLQHAIIMERVTNRLDFQDRRQDASELRLAILEGHSKAPK